MVDGRLRQGLQTATAAKTASRAATTQAGADRHAGWGRLVSIVVGSTVAEAGAVETSSISIRASAMSWSRCSGSFCEAAAEQRPEQGAAFRRGARSQSTLALEDRGQGVGDRLARERPPAREHLEEHAAEGPDVGPLVHRLAAGLLGAHVGGGAQDPSRGVSASQGAVPVSRSLSAGAAPRNALARPKSSTLTWPSGVTLTLAGLRSRWMMPFSWAASSPSAIWRKSGSASSTRRSGRVRSARPGLALDQLHDQEVAAVGLLEPVDGGDVGVVQGGEDARLALEAGQALGVLGEGSRAGP